MAKFNFLEGTLNEASMLSAIATFEIQNLDINKLIPNEKNDGFSMDGIDELSESIADVGLQQNLVVTPFGEDYKVLAGHRRLQALKKLCDEYHGAEPNPWEYIPCRVITPEDIDLPLAPDLKETYLLISTNAEARVLTAEDRKHMATELAEIYDALKAAGQKPKGRKREFIAEALGVSSATAERDLSNSEETENLVSNDTKTKIKTIDTLEHELYTVTEQNIDDMKSAYFDVSQMLSFGATLAKKDYAKLLDAQTAIVKKLVVIQKIMEKAQ